MSNRKGTQKGDGQGVVAAYLRVSTDGQEDGNGLDVQRQHIAAYAAANGLTVGMWLTDVVSGAKEDRPRLAELRKAVACGAVSTVLVYRVDRLARDLLLAETLHRELSAKAKVVSVSESFGEGFTGNLMRQIIAAFAEYERAVIAARLAGGRRSAATTKGTYSGGPGVLGYRPVGTRQERGHGVLSLVADEAEAVRIAFRLRGEGVTLKGIAGELNSRGLRTVKGAEFSPVHVHRVLKRETFYRAEGVLARSYDASVGAHEPILASATR